MSEIERKQKVEIEFWRDAEHESPEADSIHNIVNKVTDAAVFLDCINRHHKELITNGRVLELGGGQGWASCVYKKLYPNAHVTTTDISNYAVMSLPKWERLFEVKIDNSYACTSYEINESDASLDLIFCFAAAHHFLAHKRTLREISRILKPGGKAIYFNEPATPRYLYSLARWRLERTRPEVPEDMLITSELRKLAQEAELNLYVDYHPSIIKRGPFRALQAISIIRDSIPFLHPLLPCSANFIFMKNDSQPT